MDGLYLAYYLSLFVAPLIFFSVVFRKRRNSVYSKPSWYYSFKKLFARAAVRRFQEEWKYALKGVSELKQELPQQEPKKFESDGYIILASDEKGNYFSLVLNFRDTLHLDVSLEFRSKCGKIYRLPNEPSLETFSTSSRTWKAAGLNVEVLSPMRRLRITYNGIMRNIVNSHLEYVNFHFFWNAASQPIYFPSDVNEDLLADAVAREPWRDGEWIQMLGKNGGFEQFGALLGKFASTSLTEDEALFLPSWRRRRWGPIEASELNREITLFGSGTDGTVFCVGAKSLKQGATQLRYGSVLLSNGTAKSISGSDISLEYLADNMEVPTVFTIHFEVGGKVFKCVSHVNADKTTITINDSRAFGSVSKTANVECDLNSEQARGIVRFWYERRGGTGGGRELPPPLLTAKPAARPEDVLVVTLDDSKVASDTRLTGGKGSSLALLGSRATAEEFEVPPGFVVTSTAFRKHLESRPELRERLERLEKVFCGTETGDPKEMCQTITKLFEDTPLEESLKRLIESEIDNLAIPEPERVFAVRSSAIGEDSEELSAAGQNSTFLGCKGPEDVIKAVAACWGSLFTFQSVEYRRQHGLEIRSDMAVVVQKIVPSECAGVLFTSHPATGDPSQMIITSNYGLGESVVSAKVDPDTITLAKSIKGNVKILGSVVGAKTTRIVIGGGGDEVSGKTREVASSEDEAKELSLSEEQVLRLGRIGVLLEAAFGSPRDIEWGFHKGVLYLLQSRPITTLNAWSDWELRHEFDTPIVSARSVSTRANVGEVVKGAVTPLSQSFTMRALDSSMQSAVGFETTSDYHRKGLLVNSHFVFLDVTNMMFKNLKKKITLEQTITDLAIFGHPVLNEKLLEIGLSRHGTMSLIETVKFYWIQLEKILNNTSTVRLASKLNDNWGIKTKGFETPQAILAKIDFNAAALEIAMRYHTDATRTSVIYQMIAMVVLAENRAALAEDHYYDIGLLLAANENVESAEIPVVLEAIAREIRSNNLGEEFAAVDPRDASEWLREKLPKCGARLDEFLKVHGHRSFREFELFERTWDMEPSTVVAMLQSNCVADTTTRKAATLSVEETVARLRSPREKSTRRVLRYVVARCRRAVAARETTKSAVIKAIHKFRKAFFELAERAVEHGYVPSPELVFFFTVDELREHLRERNPNLVSKARRRMKLYPTWTRLRFPELNRGNPSPSADDDAPSTNTTTSSSGLVRVVGTPVCRGRVEAPARVVLDAADAGRLLRPGDVLVTRATDVAWSPYFPALAGVVTEIGGLISHGAVVAREYGLPCVVGARGATAALRSGDRVVLDANVGFVERIG